MSESIPSAFAEQEKKVIFRKDTELEENGLLTFFQISLKSKAFFLRKLSWQKVSRFTISSRTPSNQFRGSERWQLRTTADRKSCVSTCNWIFAF
mmetsp:Transcript_11998/g.28462  ORF Transcript_11998/g.28462 Transcript_11998/m.28462 type:complete len:94 (-) Transcript_11998:761-1042(-)